MASSVARGCLGGVQLLAPTLLAHLVVDQPIDPVTRLVIRVLGARQLAQAAVSLGAPRPGVVRVGQAVDGLHGLSMVALGWKTSEPVHRRLARTDAVLASLFVLSGNLALRHR